MNECNEQTHTERKRGREGENGLQRNKKKKTVQNEKLV